MKSCVLDTSALIRYYIPDGPMPEGLEGIIEQAWRGDILLLAPELVLPEAAQVLLKKERAGFLTAEESREILHYILDLPIEIRPQRDLMDISFELARTFNLTVYDAVFLAVSKTRNAPLITADNALGDAAVKALGPGMRFSPG